MSPRVALQVVVSALAPLMLKAAGEIAVVGNEDEVTTELQAYFDAGATEVIASVYPAGDDSRGSFARTTALLQALAGD